MHHGWLSVESTTTTADCLVRSTAMNGQSSQRAPGMSALAQRLPGQRTPADPSLEQPNAADLTYGWHRASSSDGEEDVLGFDQGSDTDSERVPFVDVTEEPARQEPNVTLQAAGRQSDRTDPSSAERSSMRSNWPRWWSDANGLDESSSSDQQQHPRGSGADGVGGPDAESFVCRICFDGPGSLDEGGESLGKLIAPCRCRGTMKVRVTSVQHCVWNNRLLGPITVCPSRLLDTVAGDVKTANIGDAVRPMRSTISLPKIALRGASDQQTTSDGVQLLHVHLNCLARWLYRRKDHGILGQSS